MKAPNLREVSEYADERCITCSNADLEYSRDGIYFLGCTKYEDDDQNASNLCDDYE